MQWPFLGLRWDHAVRRCCGAVVALCMLVMPVIPAFSQDADEADTPQTSTTDANSRTMLEDEVEDALELIREGQPETGTEMLRRLGELGNANAFFHLAEINRLGAGKEATEPVALMYYRFAARLGHTRASLSLANLLFFEGNGEGDVNEAIEIWQQYALEGEPEAMYLLGMVYWNGENGILPDPVRAYGLVWRASQLEYAPAVSAEPEMQSQLSDEARETALAYAATMRTKGFDNKPLALELVTDDASAIIKSYEESKGDKVKPEDWNTVWHLEVGFAMSREEIERVQARIMANEKTDVQDLFSEVVENANRPGMFRLVFGPVESMQRAVKHCVALKRAGHDCFAKPPVEE